eukprot:gene14606-31080_t
MTFKERLRALETLARALWRDGLNFPWDNTAITLRERFREDRLGITASSLTFTTTISLVPLFTVALAVFSAFPMFDRLQVTLQRWLVQSLVPPDIAKQVLAGASVSYENAPGAAGTPAVIKIGETSITGYSSKGLPADEAKKKDGEFKKAVADALKAAGYPTKADPARIDKVMVTAILVYLVLLVTMVYGPIAAMLVEMFPTRIRYTSMSLPYHIGNGWFGGLLPTTAFAIVAQTGNMYNGLWYPIIIAGATVVIGRGHLRQRLIRDARPVTLWGCRSAPTGVQGPTRKGRALCSIKGLGPRTQYNR